MYTCTGSVSTYGGTVVPSLGIRGARCINFGNIHAQVKTLDGFSIIDHRLSLQKSTVLKESNQHAKILFKIMRTAWVSHGLYLRTFFTKASTKSKAKAPPQKARKAE